jgi:hypothetical protein
MKRGLSPALFSGEWTASNAFAALGRSTCPSLAMNQLYVGFTRNVELPKGGFLFIDDEVRDIPRSRIFDPLEHCFNPLKGIEYKKARELAELLYTLSPQGENTLTVRNGKRALLKALLEADRLDKVEGDEEVSGMVRALLASPVLRRVFCEIEPVFSFKPGSKIQARINRAELGEFDALVLGLFLIGHYKGQVIVPDFGFYGRDAHASLIREGRLIAGVNFIGELSDKLRRSVLLIKEKQASGATAEDAEELASYAGLLCGTNRFNSFVEGAMV